MLLPEPFRDGIGDGGLVLLFAAVVVGVVALAWTVLVKLFEEVLKEFFKSRPLVPLAIGFLASFAALLTGHLWMLTPAILLVVVVLFAPGWVRQALARPLMVSGEILVLLALYGSQAWLLHRENAGRPYYVFLAFDREGRWEGSDDQILGRAEEYLNRHRAFFKNLPKTVPVAPRVVPDDSHALKSLPYRKADLDKVASQVMRLLGRSTFCPAVVLGTSVNLTQRPRIVLRSALYGITPAVKLTRAGTESFVLEGDDEMPYMALRATFELVQHLRGLRCDPRDGVVAGTTADPGSMRLPEDTEKEVKLVLLAEYGEVLANSDRRADLAPLAKDVQTAFDAKQVDDETVRRLLDRYVEVQPPSADVERQRRGLLAKPGALAERRG